MIKREKLNKLVVATLEVRRTSTASDLYNVIALKEPKILREEKVKSFRAFVKIINQFPEINTIGKGVKYYDIANRYKR